MAHNVSPEKRHKARLDTLLGDWPTAWLGVGCRCGWQWRLAVCDLPQAGRSLTLWQVANCFRCTAPGCGRPPERVALQADGWTRVARGGEPRPPRGHDQGVVRNSQ